MKSTFAKSMVVPATFLRSCLKITGEFPSASEKVAVKAGKPAYERRASAASISYDGWV